MNAIEGCPSSSSVPIEPICRYIYIAVLFYGFFTAFITCM